MKIRVGTVAAVAAPGSHDRVKPYADGLRALRHMADETRRLSHFLAETSYDDLSDRLLHETKRMIADTVGVSIAAAETEVVDIADTVCREPPQSYPAARVLVHGGIGRVTDAAFVNGVMAHALDFDDMHARVGGHPSVPVLPVVLALGEHLESSGSELLTAFALGAEVETVLGDVMNPGHYTHGWHPTAVLGQIGAAVAAGALYDFSETEFARVIGLAASKACGIKGNFGTMTKPQHVGNAARGGIESARLVDNGFTASESILEDENAGLCEMFQGEPPYEFGERFDALGELWGLTNPPVSFKPYPCCGSTHAPIDAALELRAAHSLALDEIERVDIIEHPRRLPHTDRPEPRTALEGKFSVQYVVATALRDGDVWLDSFTEEAVTDPEIQRFLPKIQVEPDENVTDRLADVPGAEKADWEQWDTRFTGQVPRKKHGFLRVTTKAGDVYESYVDAPTGTPPNPMSDEEIHKKYRRCVSPYLPDEQVEGALDLITDLENVDDVTRLVTALTSH